MIKAFKRNSMKKGVNNKFILIYDDWKYSQFDNVTIYFFTN
jgi:hypothetical protein